MDKIERLLEEILAELKEWRVTLNKGLWGEMWKVHKELEKANEFNRRLVKILELVLEKEGGLSLE